MSMYDLPNFEKPKFKVPGFLKNRTFWFIFSTIFISSFFGFMAGMTSGSFFYLEVKDYLSGLNISLPDKIIEKEYIPQTTHEELVIEAVKETAPAVVSIIATKDVPVFEQYYYDPFNDIESFFENPFQFQVPQYRQKGTEKQEIGGGTGFIVSKEGMILTNKHVVLDEEADYTVYTNAGESFSAKVLARDPFQDLAILEIERESVVNAEGRVVVKDFPYVKVGDSDSLQMGQTVVAIGNALGEFRGTVSVGVVSGLGRTITASGGGLVETLEDVIQTDAAINSGNSGGPLLNLRGEVIGINTAMVQDAQSIGFAIPINKAKRDIEQVKGEGKISYPFLGVRYLIVNEKIKDERGLTVSYGALILRGEDGEAAVLPDSAADKAGLKEGDIILEFNGKKITTENSLTDIIQEYDSGETVVLKILREGITEILPVTLQEREAE